MDLVEAAETSTNALQLLDLTVYLYDLCLVSICHELQSAYVYIPINSFVENHIKYIIIYLDVCWIYFLYQILTALNKLTIISEVCFIRQACFFFGLCKITFHCHPEVIAFFGSTVETVILMDLHEPLIF
jgi:hypothetical protein